jgi:hypothetical protein
MEQVRRLNLGRQAFHCGRIQQVGTVDMDGVKLAARF